MAREELWKEKYAGYIISDIKMPGYYVGPSGMLWRVQRSGAMRFTKDHALTYIESHPEEKLLIENSP